MMTVKRLQAAIVGCGKISNAHISAVQAIGAEVCAVCDRDRFRAEDVARLIGARAYGDLTSLLAAEHPDIVHILTPPATHEVLAIEALRAGCHALVEKPMALSLQEADHMLAAARENNVRLATVHNYLYKPSVTQARKLIEAGEIGAVVYVSAYYGLSGEGGAYAGSAGRAHWAWQLPGSAFTNFLPHLIYLQQAFMGRELAVAGVSLTGAEDTPTELNILLEGQAITGSMAVSMRAKPYAKFVEIYGTKGIIHADLVREVCTVHRERPMPRMLSKVIFNVEDTIQLTSGTAVNTVKVGLGRMKNMPEMRHFMRAFYTRIANGEEPPVSGEAGRAMIRIMEAVWNKAPKKFAAARPTPAHDTAEAAPRTAAERRFAGQKVGKVLVTGATGFLGHHLVAALVRCGADIRVLARDKNQVACEIAAHVELAQGDLRDPASLGAALRGVDTVFHCAAVTTNAMPWTTHHETNVCGTEAILKAAAQAGVRRVVYASSVIVYGLDRPADGHPIRESDGYAQNPEHWAYYMRSKLEADRLALRYWEEHQLPVTVLRLGVLYGEGGRPISRGLAQIGALRLLVGSGRNTLPFTYVENAVDAMLLASIAPEAPGQAYNIVDDPQVRMRDVIRQNARLSGEQAIMLPVPPGLLTMVSRFLEARRERQQAEVPPPITHYVVRSACRDIAYDTRKAHEQLGWQPEVSLVEGLSRVNGG